MRNDGESAASGDGLLEGRRHGGAVPEQRPPGKHSAFLGCPPPLALRASAPPQRRARLRLRAPWEGDATADTFREVQCWARMIPTHRAITETELRLAAVAK